MRHLFHALADTIVEVEAQQIDHTHWANLSLTLKSMRWLNRCRGGDCETNRHTSKIKSRGTGRCFC